MLPPDLPFVTFSFFFSTPPLARFLFNSSAVRPDFFSGGACFADLSNFTTFGDRAGTFASSSVSAESSGGGGGAFPFFDFVCLSTFPTEETACDVGVESTDFGFAVTAEESFDFFTFVVAELSAFFFRTVLSSLIAVFECAASILDFFAFSFPSVFFAFLLGVSTASSATLFFPFFGFSVSSTSLSLSEPFSPPPNPVQPSAGASTSAAAAAFHLASSPSPSAHDQMGRLALEFVLMWKL